MKRNEFIKRSTLATLSLALLGKVKALGTECDPTPEETEGPFPTHQPSQYIKSNITGDRTGTALTISITIHNINNQCMGLQDAVVDIWHCDSQGEYSEYGGKDDHRTGRPDSAHMPPPNFPKDSLTNKNFPPMPPPMFGGSMQQTDYTKKHFLRGRQTTNDKGEVIFHSIYPGWYVSRAPHIHVHIYDTKGNSLLVTQIAFPEDVSRVVYDNGVYAKHGQPQTTNANDMVFADSIASEMPNITGNVKDGFALRHSIYVKA